MTQHSRPEGPPPPVTVSDARLASVLDTAVDGIMVIDEQGSILMFNKACERMFGYDALEVVGLNVSILMPQPHEPGYDEYVETYRRTGCSQSIGTGQEVQGLRKDGTRIPLDLSVGEVITPEGRQFIGILRDITARKDAEQRLNELQLDLIRLARVSAFDEMGLAIAHELNQPLTAITLYLQAAGRELQRVLETGGDKTQALTILDKARQEAQRAGSIIQGVRKLCEKRAPERRSVDFNAIVEDAVCLAVVSRDRNVRVLRNYREDLPPIEVDQVQIQQVVVNFVRNAFDAVRESRGGEIVISTGVEDRYAFLSVADNGPGISPEGHADLFKTFKTGKQSGMGVGLAISRTIVQSHGGELLVDPGGGGRGARFVVRLPLPSNSDMSAGKAKVSDIKLD